MILQHSGNFSHVNAVGLMILLAGSGQERRGLLAAAMHYSTANDVYGYGSTKSEYEL